MASEPTLPAGTSQGGFSELIDAIRAQVEHQQSLAVPGFPAATSDPMPTPPTIPAKRAVVAAETRDFTAPAAGSSSSLEELRADIGDCQRCKLAPGRTNLVFGVGNPKARLVFVGEAPGHDEDLRGEPFVGRAGQLLTEIITKGMRIQREDVYICNVIKCRPPGNRNPEPDEVESCEPFLLRQLEIIGPEVIVALGKFAAQTLLRDKTPISKLRGRWFDYHGIRLMPTFHPAYLLRNPGEKRVVWEDIQQVMAVLGMPVKGS
ncbi:MAG TPA: uracil-DNA glycosylase [Candidatus Binatia bacterium]|jgi:DNA polymerase|nr:uracil-DNA glycosylase [Candidatus Binatia bacterium]